VKKDVEKKLNKIYIKVLSALNMQRNLWNILNLHQILIIATLQVMEPTLKTNDNANYYIYVMIF
jgi:hypothetical protein